MTGRTRQPIRRFEVTIPHRHAQHESSVILWYLPPKARKLRGRQIVPDNRQFYTIEQNGRVFYDSRTDVPCDMVEWERLHQKSKAQWERDKAEYAQLYGGKGIRTGHERPEFDE